jgi:hypothetical protein
LNATGNPYGGPVPGLLEPPFDEIHPERTGEAGDKPIGRPVLDVERAAELLIALVLHDPTRSASGMASIWSWVT